MKEMWGQSRGSEREMKRFQREVVGLVSTMVMEREEMGLLKTGEKLGPEKEQRWGQVWA